MAGYWTVEDERLTARQTEGDVSIIGGARGSPTCDRRGGLADIRDHVQFNLCTRNKGKGTDGGGERHKRREGGGE